MKEMHKEYGNSKLYYNDDLGVWEVERFDETITLGDMTMDEAIKLMKVIED